MLAALALAAPATPSTTTVKALRSSVSFYRQATWRAQSQMLAPLTHSNRAEKRSHSVVYLHWLADRWRARARIARAGNAAFFRRLYAKWACIHGGEGAWNSNTGNGYYGGLQMDISFQRSYNGRAVRRYGTADKWPIREQLIAAERAYKSGRGFYPWPATARACGLL